MDEFEGKESCGMKNSEQEFLNDLDNKLWKAADRLEGEIRKILASLGFWE